ncbi:hypothetical protein K2173_024008 [Erythroxylum novogranatense]|uniref:Uncharacterized protein n=1 Tax=Erythroxylum novogranatense TaxID=1862640 RepID=A0AAV8TS46_9ROSI|nr:hypothetical protein K2173_024008 [Erythroxylum novogranatense]
MTLNLANTAVLPSGAGAPLGGSLIEEGAVKGGDIVGGSEGGEGGEGIGEKDGGVSGEAVGGTAAGENNGDGGWTRIGDGAGACNGDCGTVVEAIRADTSTNNATLMFAISLLEKQTNERETNQSSNERLEV